MSARSRPSVALSGFGGLDNPEPALAVARALRARWGRRLRIQALVYDPWSSGAWISGLADNVHLVTPLARGDGAVLARLLEIHAAHPIDALIPCLDLEVSTFARLSQNLARRGIRTMLPAPDEVAAVSKVRLAGFCHEHAIRTPRTLHVADVSQVPLQADSFGYPVMVKGTVTGAKKVANREEAALAAAEVSARWGGGVLLQEVIEGEEYVVASVMHGAGRPLGMLCARKLGINARGKGVFGAAVNDRKLKRDALRILSRLPWSGPLELEFVRSGASGELMLIEVNPRFPSWILLSAFANANLPARLLEEMLHPGKGTANGRCRIGTAYARDIHEFVIPVQSLNALQKFGSAAVPGARVRQRGRDGVRVAVTGISAFDLVQPGLGIGRALRVAEDVSSVIGLAASPFDTGVYRDDVFDSVFHLDRGSGGVRLVEQVDELRKLAGGFDVLIPGLDADVALFEGIAADLGSIGVHALLPSAAALRRISKIRLFANAERKDLGGFDLPATRLVRSDSQLRKAWARLGAPMLLKGLYSGAAPAYSLAQAQSVWEQRRSAGDDCVLAQESVSGEEFGISALCDRNHELVSAFPVKKLVHCERGKVWGAIHADCPGVIASLAAFLKAIGWVGPADAEFVRDAIRERFVLIEINPRFPGWVEFSALSNVNQPQLAVQIALGNRAAPQAMARDLLLLRTSWEVPVTMRQLATYANRGGIYDG